jgi:Fe-S-cluster-containing hydrogenase component 2
LEKNPLSIKDAIIRLEELKALGMVPPLSRLRDKRPIAMIECVQEIPCNSCAVACKLGAIKMENVNAVPKIDYTKCIGCISCIMVCPGQAIFLLKVAEGLGQITMSHEFRPIPMIGDQVLALDREGRALGEAKIIRVFPADRNDGTALITVQVPVDWLFSARAIAVGKP